MDVYSAFWFCMQHPVFENNFIDCLDIEVHKVDPATNQCTGDPARDTKTRIWLECGPYCESSMLHDADLDCGGDTFEEAICALAGLVRAKYGEGGNDSAKADRPDRRGFCMEV